MLVKKREIIKLEAEFWKSEGDSKYPHGWYWLGAVRLMGQEEGDNPRTWRGWLWGQSPAGAAAFHRGTELTHWGQCNRAGAWGGDTQTNPSTLPKLLLVFSVD